MQTSLARSAQHVLPDGRQTKRGIALPTSLALWSAFTVQGFLQSALPFTLISWGEKYTDSGLAGLLNSTPPLFAFLITFFILGQADAPLRKFIGVIVGFICVLVTLGPDVLNGTTENIWGQLAVTGSSISYAVAAIYARQIFRSTSPFDGRMFNDHGNGFDGASVHFRWPAMDVNTFI